MPQNQVFEKLTDEVTLLAGVDLDAFQYHFAKYDGSGDVIPAAVLGEKTIGIIQNDANVGESALIGTGGYSRCVAGAAVLRGAAVTTNVAGRAITAVATNHVRGEAVTPAAADGDIMTVLLASYIA